jgi:hypothetical protein
MLINIFEQNQTKTMQTAEELRNHLVPLHDPTAESVGWPKEVKPRRKWQRNFSEWYCANAHRFSIHLQLLERTDKVLIVGFCGLTRVLSARVTRDEILVWIEWYDVSWDIILDLETFPTRVPNGYVCCRCPEDTRQTFPSVTALREDEVFEPFLKWVNETLANATAVSLSGSPGCSTWAELYPKSGAQERGRRLDSKE